MTDWSQRSRLDQRHNQPDGGVDRTPDHRGFPLGRCSGLHDPRSRSDLWRRRHTPIASHGHSGQTDCSGVTLAERLCRTADRIDPARVFGPHHCLGRGTSAPDSNFLCRLLQLRQNASFIEQGCADVSSDSTDRNHSFTPDPRRASPSLRPDLSFRYTQRDLSTLASLRALWARTPEPAWARRVVGEGVKFCPRAGCGKSACPVVCPAKAGMFSRRQTCRGRSQSPVVWIAEVMETETLKPIDKVSPGEATSHRAVTTVNALWPRK